MKCEIALCKKDSRFDIRDMKTGKWIHVCGTHDSFIGIRNLEMQGETHEAASRINKQVKAFEGEKNE